MENLFLIPAPTSFLQCFDDDNELDLEKFFAYRRNQDREEQQRRNNLIIHGPLAHGNNIRFRRFKKRPSGIVFPNGEQFQVTPRSSVWYIVYVTNPVLEDENFHKKFRLRFRVPYDSFIRLSQEMKRSTLFEQWNGYTDCTGTLSTPIELLILASLRILGRDWKLDDFEEIIGVSHCTIRVFFHTFCKYGATVLFDRYVKMPQTQEELYSHMQDYTRLGLNGCVGSMDATHIQSCRIPGELVQAHSSFKSSLPSRAYNITVNHKRRILYSTRGFPARWNDKTIVRFDKFYCQILNDTIGSNVKFFLHYFDQVSQTVKQQQYSGCWLIVDNGYLTRSCTVPPMKNTLYKDEMMWSKWIESVRKDVECTFYRSLETLAVIVAM